MIGWPRIAVAVGAAVLAALVAALACSPPRRRARRLDDGAPGWSSAILGKRLRRRPAASADDIAGWCDHLARQLRSGASLTAAVVSSGDVAATMTPSVMMVAAQVRRGASLVAAIDGVLAGHGRHGGSHGGSRGIDASGDVGLALTVVRTCARLGGPAAGPLQRAAATLRARAAIAAEQRAQSAQALLSARVLTLVPLALLALLVVTDPKVRATVTSSAGLALIVAGAALNGLGAWWMRRIIGRPA